MCILCSFLFLYRCRSKCQIVALLWRGCRDKFGTTSHDFILRLFAVGVKVDAFAEKNNMTEAVNVAKEFLSGISLNKEKVAGDQNQTAITTLAVPSHPLVERLQNIKVKNSESHLPPQTPL